MHDHGTAHRSGGSQPAGAPPARSRGRSDTFQRTATDAGVAGPTDLGALRAVDLLGLQRSVGNQVVRTLIARTTGADVQRAEIHTGAALRGALPWLPEVIDTTRFTRRELAALVEQIEGSGQHERAAEEKFGVPAAMLPPKKRYPSLPVVEGLRDAIADEDYRHWDEEELGAEGSATVATLMQNLAPLAADFVSWAGRNDVEIRFTGSALAGAQGETTLQAEIQGAFVTIDEPGVPFTGWHQMDATTPLRVLIRLARPGDPEALEAAAHELIVHGMRYRNLVRSLRAASNLRAEFPLLFHFFLARGDLSAEEHHATHGAGEGETATGAGPFPSSGYEAFNQQIVALVDTLAAEGKMESAQAVVAAAGRDIGMQQEEHGNLEASATQADHSLGLLIVYLLAREKIPEPQQQSCRLVLGGLDETWRAVLDAYHRYKMINGEKPFKTLAGPPSKKIGRLKNLPEPVSMSGWLVFAPEHVLEALLEHVAATGEELAAGEPVEGRGAVTVEAIKPGLVTEMGENVEAAQAYVAFRALLDEALHRDPERWHALAELLKQL